MSADNYMVVDKVNGRYYVSNQFASDDVWETPEEVAARQEKLGNHGYDTFDEAVEYADSEYSEYGVSIRVPHKTVELEEEE